MKFYAVVVLLIGLAAVAQGASIKDWFRPKTTAAAPSFDFDEANKRVMESLSGIVNHASDAVGAILSWVRPVANGAWSRASPLVSEGLSKASEHYNRVVKQAQQLLPPLQ